MCRRSTRRSGPTCRNDLTRLSRAAARGAVIFRPCQTRCADRRRLPMTDLDLCYMPASEALRLFKAKKLSPVELM
ncbi:hypothetical protein EN912_31400, partial [Mesorhizobium sp. M7A.F.Ca.CA.004.02.1.1]